MDPVTIIVAALAAGAAAGLTATAEQATKDAYAGIKQWIQDRYADISLTALEKDPKSTKQQVRLAEDLADAGATTDAKLIAKVQGLLDTLEKNAAATKAAAAIGVDIARTKAASLKIKSVHSSDTGVKIEDSEFTGDIEIGDVTAGIGGTPDPNA